MNLLNTVNHAIASGTSLYDLFDDSINLSAICAWWRCQVPLYALFTDDLSAESIFYVMQKLFMMECCSVPHQFEVL